MSPSMSLANWAATYCDSRLGLRPSSREQLQVAVHLLCAWAGRVVYLHDLSGPFVLRFLRDYLEHHSPASTNSKRRSLLTLWRAAAADGSIPPPGTIATVPEPERLPQAWTVDQVEQLICRLRTMEGSIEGVPRRYWWPSLVLAIYWTGSRVSAMLSTRSDDCNLGERYLIVRAASQKTNRDRLFWLSDQAVASIAAHYDPKRPKVWPWPYHRRSLWQCFRRHVEAIGLPSSHRGMDLFHRLRRTNLSYCAAAGGIDAARRQAGHSSARLTESRYVDPSIYRQQSAADLVPTLRV